MQVAGGAAAIGQYLAMGVVDELELHVAPVLLGGATRMFDDTPPRRLDQPSVVDSSRVPRLRYRLRAASASTGADGVELGGLEFPTFWVRSGP